MQVRPLSHRGIPISRANSPDRHTRYANICAFLNFFPFLRKSRTVGANRKLSSSEASAARTLKLRGNYLEIIRGIPLRGSLCACRPFRGDCRDLSAKKGPSRRVWRGDASCYPDQWPRCQEKCTAGWERSAWQEPSGTTFLSHSSWHHLVTQCQDSRRVT